MFARQGKHRAVARKPVTRPVGLPGFLRSVSPAAVAVTVSLLIGGAGFADAATGGTFILGKANTASSTTSLSDSSGTPLSLSAPHGTPPLKVNRNAMVKNLNAQYVGGQTSTKLAATGGEGFTTLNTNTPINNVGPTVVTSTGILPAGTYYVIATASLNVAPGDVHGYCWIAKARPNTPYNQALGDEGEYALTESAAMNVTAGQIINEDCISAGTNGSVVNDAGIMAIRVLSSHHF